MIKKGHYHNIPIFIDLSTGEIEGRNTLYDIAVDIMIFVDTEILQVEEFAIWIEEDD